MTRKPWSHVRILIYRTWAIMPTMARLMESPLIFNPNRSQKGAFLFFLSQPLLTQGLYEPHPSPATFNKTVGFGLAEIAASQIVADRKGNAFIVEKIVKNCYAFYYYNRQYSYSPTVLGRVGLGHECEAHAGNFSIRGQTNMRKLRLGLPNLRKIFNIVKF